MTRNKLLDALTPSLDIAIGMASEEVEEYFKEEITIIIDPPINGQPVKFKIRAVVGDDQAQILCYNPFVEKRQGH